MVFAIHRKETNDYAVFDDKMNRVLEVVPLNAPVRVLELRKMWEDMIIKIRNNYAEHADGFRQIFKIAVPDGDELFDEIVKHYVKEN